MFDSIARPQPTPRRRQVASMVISLSVNSGIVWLVAVMSSQVVSEVPGMAQAHEVVMVESAAGSGGARLPEAPAAPEPPAAPEAVAPEPLIEDAVVPTEPPTDAPPVPAVQVTAPPAEPSALQGSGGGSGGAGNGTGTGTGSGTGSGTGFGTGFGDDHGEATLTQVRPLRVIKPRFPPAALALGLPEVRCTADVRIDERGRPTAASVDGCPVVYRQAVVDAMLRWRFEPATIDGQAVPARFRQPFRFQLQGG